MPFRLQRPAGPLKRRFLGRVAREGGVASVSDEWRAWIVENLALGMAVADLRATLRANGVPDVVASREIEGLRRSPLAAAAARLGRMLKRHDLVERLKREVAALAGPQSPVERRSGVQWEEFHERYYVGNVPVVITDALERWPNLTRWSPSYFKEHFGDAEVEVMTRREGERMPRDDIEGHRTPARLGEFCDRVTSTGSTNDFYLVANNRATNRAALSRLLDDVSAPHPYLHDGRDARWTSMWFGPPGTITPLHHDTANVLFCQVFGKKRFLLLPPSELFLTHAMRDGVYSAIDLEHPDVEAFPELAEVAPREVVLSPGEGLFLPVGWWHHVRALDVCISLAFTAFRWHNRFEWYYPGKVD